MAGNRIGRINEEIRKELSALLRTVKESSKVDIKSVFLFCVSFSIFVPS